MRENRPIANKPYDHALDGVIRIIGFCVLALGVAILAGGAWWMHHIHADLFLTGMKAEARVTDVIRTDRVNRHGSAIYCATLKFSDGHGRQITVPEAECSGNLPLSKGQGAATFYNPEKPGEVMIDRGAKNFIIPGVILMFGGLTVLGGVSRINRPGVWVKRRP